MAPDVARLFLEPDAPLGHRPGQSLDVLHPSGAARSDSIASLPAGGPLELHVRRVPNGLVSGWLQDLGPGAVLRVRGPFGQCYHVPDVRRRTLLLVGTGTGLAPLLGIARDAIDHRHEGAIDLAHGGVEPGRLYLREELDALAADWPRLRVHRCVLGGATARKHEGALDEVAVRLAGPLEHVRAFLCSDDAIVRRLLGEASSEGA